MTNHTMLPALVALAFAQQAAVAIADDVPTLDVSVLCRAEAKMAQASAQACMADQKQAREDLVRQWAQFAPESRARCTQVVTSIAGIQSYIELLTCLQMAKDVKSLRKE